MKKILFLLFILGVMGITSFAAQFGGLTRSAADSLYLTSSEANSLYATFTTGVTTVEVAITDTWQDTFDELPDIINHTTNINLAAGTYTETSPTIAKLSTNADDVATILFIRGAVNIVNATATADGGSRTTLTDTGAFTGQDFSTGKYYLRLLSGNNYTDISLYPQFSNDFPIKSNTDDALTLDCQLASVLGATTTYQIITNATTLEGADGYTDYGLVVKGSQSLMVNIKNVNFTKSYYGIDNYSYVWVNSCGFIEGPANIGYSGVIFQEGAKGFVDKSYFTGTWSNGDVGVKKFGSATVRQNSFGSGTRAIDVEGNGAHGYLYGNYIHDKVNGAIASWGGLIETSSNVNTGNIIDNCSDSAMYATYGSTIILNKAKGDANQSVAETYGSGTVQYDSGNFTSTVGNLNYFNDRAGTIIDDETSTVYHGGVYTTTAGGIDLTGTLTAETITDGTFTVSGGTLEGVGGLTATGDLDIGAHGFRSNTLTADGLTTGRLITAGADGILSSSAITENAGALGGITTIAMSGQLTNTLAGGTAPMVITSGTKVANLNVDAVDGYSLDQNVLTTSAPTFVGMNRPGGNGAFLVSGVTQEVITIAALSATAASTLNLLPVNSFIRGVTFYTTDGTGGPATTVVIGPTGGTADIFIKDETASTTGDSGNMFESQFGNFRHMSNFFNTTAKTITITLSGATTVDDPLSMRVIIWYDQLTEPTS